MNLKQINALMAEDMAGVNQLIGSELQSDVALINQLGLYIVNSGGKRLRPLLAVTAARAVGYQGHGHLTLATIVEFIHTATLLHDDVVDASELRRGENRQRRIWQRSQRTRRRLFIHARLSINGHLKLHEGDENPS